MSWVINMSACCMGMHLTVKATDNKKWIKITTKKNKRSVVQIMNEVTVLYLLIIT